MEPKKYQEIFSKVYPHLPEKWEKVALYFLFSGNMISHEFYVDSGFGYISCFGLGYNDSTLHSIFNSLEDILTQERAKLPEDKIWSVFTMFVDSSGKFDVNFKYGNMSKNFIKFQEKWEKKYIRQK